MRRLFKGFVVAGGTALVMAIALALPTPGLAAVQITHDGVGCVVAGRFPVIQARLQPADQVARARVYFHARGTADWYFVDMESEGDAAFEGILPQPLETLDGIDYYIETLEPGFVQGRSPEYSARVVTGSQACPAGQATATAMSSVPSALLVGAPEGAPALPPGFADVGLAGSVGGAGAAGAGSGGGISSGVLLGVAAAAGAGVAVAVATSGDDGVAAMPTTPGSAGGGMPEPTPTPTPVPTPEVSGRWAGTFDENPSATQCSVQNDLSMDLQQSGIAVSGTFQLMIRAATPAPQDPCPVRAGDVFGGPVSGNVNGDTLSLQLQIAGGPAFFLSGTISGNRIGGSSPPDSDGPGGNWEVTRQ